MSSDLLQAPAEAIQQFVLKQEQLNADESSWRIMKKRGMVQKRAKSGNTRRSRTCLLLGWFLHVSVIGFIYGLFMLPA